MFRIVMTCFVVAATTAGCAQLPVSSGQPYSIVGTRAPCPELEGSGDCQPAPGEASLSQASENPPALNGDST
jgi:hypothetical protein